MIIQTMKMFACVVLLVGMAGCGGGFDSASALQEVNATNPQRLSNLYVQHQRENGGKGPKDKAAFRAYINKMNPVLLERIGVDQSAIDDLFVSERDGEALKIRYGVKGNDFSPPTPIVFEAIGVDGVRIVAFTGQKFEEVSDDAEYKKLLGNAK
jgi:hypothetical protein